LVLAALAAQLVVTQTELLDLTQFLIQQRQVHTQDVLLPTAVDMAEPVIMGAVHPAVLVVLAAEGGGLTPLLAVLELLVKETLAAQAVHLLAGVGVVQELLALPTLMVARGLLLLFRGLLLLMLAAAAVVAQVFLVV
jgi:hypothetical protein